MCSASTSASSEVSGTVGASTRSNAARTYSLTVSPPASAVMRAYSSGVSSGRTGCRSGGAGRGTTRSRRRSAWLSSASICTGTTCGMSTPHGWSRRAPAGAGARPTRACFHHHDRALRQPEVRKPAGRRRAPRIRQGFEPSPRSGASVCQDSVKNDSRRPLKRLRKRTSSSSAKS